MAIPYDATQHIQGIAQGVQNAMPGIQAGIQAKQAGNPDLEAFINNSMDDYVRRRKAGEPKENIIADYLQRLQATQYPNATQSVQSVGVNAGTPSLGTPDMSAMSSQPPNSFPAQGSFNGLTPPPTAMGAGITGNAVKPTVNFTPEGALPADNEGAYTGGEKLVTLPAMPGSNSSEKTNESPIPYEEKPKIDLTAGRMGGNMNTGHGSPIPRMRTRAEQEQALSDIERMKKIEHGDDALDIKRMKLEQDSQLAIIKNMRLSKNDIAELQAKIQGLEQKAQIAVVDMWLKQKAMEQKFSLGKEGNEIRRMKVAGSAKIDPRLQHLWVRYKAARDEIARYQTSLVAGDNGNPDTIKKLKKILINEMHEYNKQAVELGLPEITSIDQPVPEGFIPPEDRTGLPTGSD